MEDVFLPTFGEDAEEEEAQGDFQQGCRENIEDFAKLDVLHCLVSISMGGLGWAIRLS